MVGRVVRRAKQKTATISLRLQEPVIEEYTIVAEELGFSRNQLMELALNELQKKGVFEHKGKKWRWKELVEYLRSQEEQQN